MDKTPNPSRPYDDLNAITTPDEPEDAEMEEGEKAEGEDNNNNNGNIPMPRPPGMRRAHMPMHSNLNISEFADNFTALSGNRNVFPPQAAHIPGYGPQFNQPRPKDDTAKQFDFRHNKMPEGVTIIGEGALEEQQDKSTALVLGPKSCLNVDCTFSAIHPTR